MYLFRNSITFIKTVLTINCMHNKQRATFYKQFYLNLEGIFESLWLKQLFQLFGKSCFFHPISRQQNYHHFLSNRSYIFSIFSLQPQNCKIKFHVFRLMNLKLGKVLSKLSLIWVIQLTLSWRRSASYKNQSTDLQSNRFQNPVKHQR